MWLQINIFGINFALLHYIECNEASFTISDSVLGSIVFQLQGHLDLPLESEGFGHFLLILGPYVYRHFLSKSKNNTCSESKIFRFSQIIYIFPQNSIASWIQIKNRHFMFLNYLWFLINSVKIWFLINGKVPSESAH